MLIFVAIPLIGINAVQLIYNLNDSGSVASPFEIGWHLLMQV